jgi:hypothetical protein
VVPDAVVWASPADIADTSTSVASVFSCIFIGSLSFCLVIACGHDFLRAGKTAQRAISVFIREES